MKMMQYLLSEQAARHQEMQHVLSASVHSNVNLDTNHPFHLIFQQGADLAVCYCITCMSLFNTVITSFINHTVHLLAAAAIH